MKRRRPLRAASVEQFFRITVASRYCAISFRMLCNIFSQVAIPVLGICPAGWQLPTASDPGNTADIQ